MLKAFMTHGSNAVLLGASLAGIVAHMASIVSLPPLFILAGALLFHLSEYTTHRFLFHAPPSRFPWLRRMQHRLHYDHHVEPDRLDLLFLPLWFVIPNLAMTGLLAHAILSDWQAVTALLLGSILALLHYEWVHYVAHIPYKPVTRFGRWMKKYHLWHHYKNEHFWFGVSNPVLDVLHRTYRKPDQVTRSTTVRVLHPAMADRETLPL
jgi:hypothetical protein